MCTYTLPSRDDDAKTLCQHLYCAIHWNVIIANSKNIAPVSESAFALYLSRVVGGGGGKLNWKSAAVIILLILVYWILSLSFALFLAVVVVRD
jgi:hypothetical protein